MASVDGTCPTSLALLLALIHDRLSWAFWQIPDPDTVKQAASPVDKRAVADERSVRPERMPPCGVVTPQDAHGANFHFLGGQVSSETMGLALPATGACVRPAPSLPVETTFVTVFVGGMGWQDQMSISLKGALYLSQVTAALSSTILTAALSFCLLLCIVSLSETPSSSCTVTPTNVSPVPSLHPFAALAYDGRGRIPPDTGGPPSGGDHDVAGFECCHLVDQLPIPRLQSYPSTPQQPALASTLASALASKLSLLIETVTSSSPQGDHLLNRPSFAPCNVLDIQRILVVRVDDVVAEVAGVLALSAMHVAAAKDELLAPDRACAALRHDVILGAEEQVGYQWPADAIVPCLWVGRECFAPDLANTSSVVCVVQVQLLELSFAIDARDALQVHLQLLGALTAIKLAIAAENPGDWRESTDIGRLVLCLCVLDEGGVVCLTQPRAHAVMVSNARLGLGEEGAPAIGRALEADALHSWAGRAGSCVYWRAASQQGQCCDGLHCSQVSVGPTGTA